MLGGHSQEKSITEEEIQMCNTMKAKIEGHMNATYTVWEPVSYTSQVVAGTNFVFKIKFEAISIK